MLLPTKIVISTCKCILYASFIYGFLKAKLFRISVFFLLFISSINSFCVMPLLFQGLFCTKFMILTIFLNSEISKLPVSETMAFYCQYNFKPGIIPRHFMRNKYNNGGPRPKQIRLFQIYKHNWNKVKRSAWEPIVLYYFSQIMW